MKNVDFEGIKHNNYNLEERKSKNYQTKPKIYKNLTISIITQLCVNA